jgi:hypothetical protein
MAFLALIAVLLGLPLAAFNAGGTAPSSAQAQAVRATLDVRSTRPLVVAGHGFVPAERVRVDADGRVKQVTANRSGRFVVRFAGIDTCSGLVLVARGSRGSRAEISFAQLSNIHCL